ncbi:hypothetical protein ABZ330_01365 [Streptomyces sp. NPDC006172]|uniref:hypothetical protein n=1 Tax=Streptomyces sp. NPDC006172 TaxID=3154470 RepID=UPI0034116ED0
MNDETHEAHEPHETHTAYGGPEAPDAHNAHDAYDAHDERHFEELVRELMTDDAYTIHPSPAPYPAIRRRGVAERRRRVAAVGAALAAIVTVPAAAYAVAGGNGGGGADTATPMSSVSAPQSASASQSPASGPARLATDGQLLDGITFDAATEALQECLTAEHVARVVGKDAGRAENYRIILAAKSTGDSNSPGDGVHVVGVAQRPAGFRVICDVKDGVSAGISTSTQNGETSAARPVVPDDNAGGLYRQSLIDKGQWKLPYRWASIGTVDPSVAKVTVSYGDSDATAALDHGWFVAAGILNRQVTEAPHIKGFDASGKQVYDSDTDTAYDKTLP